MTAKEARHIADNERAKMIANWTPAINKECKKILTKYIPKLAEQGERKYNDVYYAPRRIREEVEQIFKNYFEPLGYEASYKQGIIVIKW
jgi:hypothetical protein